jgi:hypothetical protein
LCRLHLLYFMDINNFINKYRIKAKIYGQYFLDYLCCNCGVSHNVMLHFKKIEA